MTAIIITAIICLTLIIIIGLAAWMANREKRNTEDVINRLFKGQQK